MEWVFFLCSLDNLLQKKRDCFLFLPYQFWKTKNKTKQKKKEKKNEFIRYGFSLVWVLVLILIRTISEQSVNNKMVSKIWSKFSNVQTGPQEHLQYKIDVENGF